MSRFVAYDLGTNTFRWLAAEVSDGQVRELGRGREMVGMGRSLQASGCFLAPEIDEASAVLQAWRPGGKIVPAADAVLATATHAFRAAKNGAEIAARLAASSGIPIDIVPPEREAALTFRGALGDNSHALAQKRAAILDIGGGSTELSWGENGRLQDALSLPVGVVTLAAPQNETLTASIGRVRAALERTYAEAYNELPSMAFRKLANVSLYATCGTSSALALEHAGLTAYDRHKLDGLRIDGNWLASLLKQRAEWTPERWRDLEPVGAKRATLMGPGIGILAYFLDALQATSWTNCEAGLLEGALADLIDRHATRRA